MNATPPTLAWIPYGDRNSPSARLRVYEVAERLQRDYGVLNHIAPFNLKSVPRALIAQKTADAKVLAVARNLKELGSKFFYDLSDPVWLQKELCDRQGWDVGAMTALADAVLVPTLAMGEEVARKFPAARWRRIADAVNLDLPAFRRIKTHAPGEVFRVGWIGTSLNMEHLYPLAEILARVGRGGPVEFRLITAAHQSMIPALPRIKVEYVPWALDSYAAELQACDAVVLPMPINEWTRTKSPNRLQLCMALGVPAVISPMPSCLDMIEGHEGLAFVADAPDQWVSALERLRDPALRSVMAIAGRELIEREHSLEKRIAEWAEVLLK